MTDVVETLDPIEEDLKYTQTIRKSIVTAITNQAPYEELIRNEEFSKLLMQTLRDMDHQALTNKRIKSDDANVDKLVANKALVAEILSTLSPRDAIYSNGSNNNRTSLDETDGKRDYVLDETMVGESNLNVDDFQQRQASL